MTDVLNEASCSIQKPWREVPAAGIYCVDLSDSSVARNNVLHELVCYPWLKPCSSEPIERRVVPTADATTLCDAASALEQAWGGVTVRRAQLGVVAPLGFFNTALPCVIDATTTSCDQSVEDVATGLRVDGLGGRLPEGCTVGDELTRLCIVTSHQARARSATSHDTHVPSVSRDTHASVVSHDTHVPPVSHDTHAAVVSHDTHVPSMSHDTCAPAVSHEMRAPPVSQTVTTSCTNTDHTTNTIAPAVPSTAGHVVTTNPMEGAASSLTKWATQRQWELSKKLLDFLSEAVRLRVQLQASRCHQCLSQVLCEGRESGDRPNGLSFVDAPVAVRAGTSVSMHGDDSPANSIAVSREGDNHGSHHHGNVDDYPVGETTEDLTLHHTSSVPRQTDNGSDQSRRPDSNRPEVRCRHARVSVLFSGGIDSLVLAALADR